MHENVPGSLVYFMHFIGGYFKHNVPESGYAAAVSVRRVFSLKQKERKRKQKVNMLEK